MTTLRERDDSLPSNLHTLEAFWNRNPFHDREVESIRRLRGKAVIRLDRYVLVLTGVTDYSESVEEYPTAWISHQVQTMEPAATLQIQLELGTVTAKFTNLRLLRREDLAMLVPPLDS